MKNDFQKIAAELRRLLEKSQINAISAIARPGWSRVAAREEGRAEAFEEALAVLVRHYDFDSGE
jgi:hypothetical protein